MAETKKITTPKVSNDELMEKHTQMVQFVKNTISGIETDLKRIKIILNKLSKFDPKDPESLNDKELEETIGATDLKSYKEDNVQVIE
jgi:hypothetical protein